MKIPKRLQPLVDDGLIDEVLHQLMSGKEAQVFVVRCGGEQRCAKVFKEATKRSFKQAVQYQEGRKVRNSRRARAMAKKTRFGQQEQEDAWLNAEVDALYRLAAAGVRVPEPVRLRRRRAADGTGHRCRWQRRARLGRRRPHARTGPGLPRPDDRRGGAHAHAPAWSMAICPNSMCCSTATARSSSTCPRRWMPRATTTPDACWSATSTTCARYFGRFAPALLRPTTARKSGRCTRAGDLHPDSRLTGLLRARHPHRRRRRTDGRHRRRPRRSRAPRTRA